MQTQKVEATNPVFEFVGYEPVSKKRKKKLEDSLPSLVDPLSYGELRRLGFEDLVDPIFDLGGYVAVSLQMGISVAPLPPPKPAPDMGLIREEEAPGLALGAALDERMATASASRGRLASAKSRVGDFDMRGMPDAPGRYSKVKSKSAKEAEKAAKEDATIRLAQPLEIPLAQRTYAIVVAASAALGWGHASPLAVSSGILGAGVIDLSQFLSCGLIVGNALAAVLAVQAASKYGRKPQIWAFKAVLGGPLTLLELRSLGDISA